MSEHTASNAGQLLVSAAIPVTEICMIAALGAIMVHKGLFDSAACTALARANINLFIPALTFSKLSSTITSQSIPFLWPLLLNMALDVGIGLGVGWLMARLLACPVAFRRHVTCSVAFANVGNLPLVFVAALCHDPRTAFHRTLGARCEHLGISYIAVSIFAATFLQFTIAVRMLRPPVTVSIGGAEGKSELAEESDQGLIAAPVRARVGSTWGAPPLAPPSSGEGERAPLLRFDTQTSMRSSVELSLWSSDGRVDHGAFLAMSGDSFRRATDDEADEVEVLVDSHGEWHRPGPSDGAGMCGERTGTSGPTNGPPADGSPVPPMDQPMPRHRLRRAASWALQGLARLPQSILSSPPPATAAVLGVLVGCIGPVRDLLYPASADPESGVPALFFLSDTIVTVSGAMIPCAIVLLGAVLYRSWREQGGSLPARVVAGTIFCRLVVLPAITTPLILLAVKLHLITVIDPLFFFCLLAAHMSPTAINMQTLTVLYKHGEAEVSMILFWCYVSSIVTLPAWTWLSLKLVVGLDLGP